MQGLLEQEFMNAVHQASNIDWACIGKAFGGVVLAGIGFELFSNNPNPKESTLG